LVTVRVGETGAGVGGLTCLGGTGLEEKISSSSSSLSANISVTLLEFEKISTAGAAAAAGMDEVDLPGRLMIAGRVEPELDAVIGVIEDAPRGT